MKDIINNGFLFLSLQIRLRPQVGCSDDAYKKEWRRILEKAESDLLESAINHTHLQGLKYQQEAKDSFDQLRAAMSDSLDQFREAEAAAATVSTRIKAQETTKLRKRWAIDVERSGTEGLVKPNKKQKKPKATREPEPSTSTNQRGPKRTTKKAKRRLDPKEVERIQRENAEWKSFLAKITRK